MSHRNKNLIFTLSDTNEQTVNLNLTKNSNSEDKTNDVKINEIKTNEIKTNEDKINNVKINEIKTNEIKTNKDKTNEIKTNYIKPDEVKIDKFDVNKYYETKKRIISTHNSTSKKIKQNEPRRSMRIAEKQNKQTKIVDSQSITITDSISEESSSETTEIIEITSDSVPNKNIFNKNEGTNIISLLPKKLFPIDNAEKDFILSCLEKEEWFNNLTENKQNHYIERMREIITYKKDLPSLKQIMDLDNAIGLDHIKILAGDRLNINDLDKLSSEYDEACHQFYKKYLFFTNKENFAKHEKIRNAENEILENPIFSESMRERILGSNINIDTKTMIYEKYLMSPTSGKCKKWINTILSLPQQLKKIIINENIPKNEAISLMIKKIMCKFNEQVYGMQEAKEEFACFITNIIGNPQCKNKAIGMCGPPGVGKTMIARIVADVLNLPMEQIALGGVTDSQFLEGHGYTYIGSEPGQIVKSISKMGYINGIIFFDEIDKISKTHYGKEVEHSLLHIIDFTQNHDFRDKYIPEIPIDLSNYIFVYSMNSIEDMDSALVSRIPIIKIDGYNKKEKEIIITDYILPEILKNSGFNTGDIIMDKSTIDYLISIVKEEDEKNGKSGVRGLKKAINRIISRLNLYKLASVNGKMNIDLSFNIPNFNLPYTVSVDIAQKILANSLKSDSTHNMYI